MDIGPLRPDQTDDGALYDKIDADKINADLAEADRIAGHTRIIVLATIAVLLVTGLAVVFTRASGSTAPAAAARNVVGEITLRGNTSFDNYRGATVGSECFGYRGYADVKEGAQVLLLDGAGVTIGTSSLNQGTIRSDGGGGAASCTFTFSVADVPKVDFYRVKISHRDGPTWSLADLEGRGWRVELILG